MIDFSIVHLRNSVHYENEIIIEKNSFNNRNDELDSFDKEFSEAEMVRVVVLVTAHANFLYSEIFFLLSSFSFFFPRYSSVQYQ